MKCPKCGKEVELQTKKVGTSESGDPIYNEYAICRDCKKQWNLDKQRAKKAAESVKKEEPKAPVKEPAPKATPVKEQTPTAPPVKAKAPNPAPVKKVAATERPESKRPAKARPVEEPAQRPIKARPVEPKKPAAPTSSRPTPKATETKEPKYSNIPPKKVRAKREEAVKSNYETMLSINPDVEEPTKKKVVPKFRILRILLGIISLAAFGFFCYKGLIAGLDDVTSGNLTSIGSIYIILATCMLVSGLLLLILQKKNSLVAFLIPALFYLGSAVFAFFMKSKDIFFLYVAVIFAVMTIIMLILTFASRGNDEFEDDEEDDDFDVAEFDDDEFDDDFDDDEFDDEFDED